MRIAIVGAGVSGLVAAHLLAVRARRDVVRGERRRRRARQHGARGDRGRPLGRRHRLRRLQRPHVRRADFLGDPTLPLDVAVRDLVEERLGTRPRGPVRMLAHLRYLGHCFNPVTVCWCFAPDGERVEAVVAEVTSTPWSERHAYVAPATGNPGDVVDSRHDKAMHVSPLLPMDLTFRWRVSTPGARIAIAIDCERDGERVLDAHPEAAR
jgi:DUF1365 family protein